MLVLSRKRGESIRIGDGIVITILDVRPSRTRIGIDAPSSIRVQRDEHRPHIEVENVGATSNYASPPGKPCEDLVKSSCVSGALGDFQSRKVTVARI